MRVKTAECAALFWDEGKLVWDDYLAHRQFALTEKSERVLWWFRAWRDLDSIREHDTDLALIAKHLLDARLLIAENSLAHREEERVMTRWREWGPAARHYHFSARTRDGMRYWTLEEDRVQMREKARQSPPPAPFKIYQDRPFVSLPDRVPTDEGWPRARLVEALYQRRSTRSFSDCPLTVDELGALLHSGGGIVDIIDDSVTGPSVFKTSPSAGARDPIELYVHAARVSGLPPGLYHFAPRRSGLEALGPEISREELSAALGGQPWLLDAAAIVIYTAVIERTQWRYPTRRAYRDILIGLGHVSQTVLLTASAMGLGAVTATAVCDEGLERLIGCDPTSEPALAVAALGRVAESAG